MNVRNRLWVAIGIAVLAAPCLALSAPPPTAGDRANADSAAAEGSVKELPIAKTGLGPEFGPITQERPRVPRMAGAPGRQECRRSFR